jgi:hypothetical protein
LLSVRTFIPSPPARYAAALSWACLLAATAAQAQDFITPDCRASAPAIAQIRFDDPAHQAWYRRFWSGRCEGLAPFTCMSGYPNWNAVVAQLTAEAAPADRARLLPEICGMGRTIGLEWARDNAVRRISTNDLKSLTTVLTGPGPLPSRLQRVEAQVRVLLARPR